MGMTIREFKAESRMTDREKRLLRLLIDEQKKIFERRSRLRRLIDPKHAEGQTR